MDFQSINLIAILLSAISNSIIGALWYSVLFGNIWINAMKKTKETIDKSGANLGYALTFVAAIVTASILSLVIGLFDTVTLGKGAMVGFLLGVGIAATRELSPTFFEGRKLVLYFISIGYHIVSLTVMGIILAAFM